jgi:heme-degrading monooxygenase HmoA
MFVTILTGRVAEGDWSTLEESYERTIRTGFDGILSSMLVQCQTEPDLWQIITTWESQEDYKNAFEQQFGKWYLSLFVEGGSSPNRNEYNVFGHYTRV